MSPKDSSTGHRLYPAMYYSGHPRPLPWTRLLLAGVGLVAAFYIGDNIRDGIAPTVIRVPQDRPKLTDEESQVQV
jgi:hypothetical protein